MARRPVRTTPDDPDLPETLEPGPAELGRGVRHEGLAFGPETTLPDRLPDLELVECRLTGVDLAARRLSGLSARDVVFTECDLAGAVLSMGSTLTRVRFEACRMTGVALAGAEATDVVIRGGTAELANLRGLRAKRLWALGGILREADFSEASLTDVALLDCDLAGADFRGTQVSGLSLHGSAIERIRSASALTKGLRIDADQLVPLGLALVHDLGPEVTGRPDGSSPGRPPDGSD